MSSSTAASGSKHPREEEGDVEGPTHAKRQRLDEEGEAGPCTSSTGGVTPEGASGEGTSGDGVSGSGEGVTSESDEEYQVGETESGVERSSADEDGNDDAESSDISAEEEEVEDTEEGGSNIICGQGVELKEIKNGKYRLYHTHNGREMKILLSQEAVTSAEKLARDKQSDNQIAVLEAQGAEVTRDERDEVIVYATSLDASDTKYHYLEDDTDIEITNGTSILLQGNKLVVVRVAGVEELFATGDFNNQEVED